MIRAVRAERTRTEGEGQAVGALDPTDPTVSVEGAGPVVPETQGILHPLL